MPAISSVFSVVRLAVHAEALCLQACPDLRILSTRRNKNTVLNVICLKEDSRRKR